MVYQSIYISSQGSSDQALFFVGSGKTCISRGFPDAEGWTYGSDGVSERTTRAAEARAPNCHLQPGEESCTGQLQVSVMMNKQPYCSMFFLTCKFSLRKKSSNQAVTISFQLYCRASSSHFTTAGFWLSNISFLFSDRLKKEMQQHIAAVATEFHKVSDKKMPETTKRAIHENMLVTSQLRQISDRCKELMVENDALNAREKKLKREMEIMEPLLNEMTRKSLANQKVASNTLPNIWKYGQKCLKTLFVISDNFPHILAAVNKTHTQRKINCSTQGKTNGLATFNQLGLQGILQLPVNHVACTFKKLPLLG